MCSCSGSLLAAALLLLAAAPVTGSRLCRPAGLSRDAVLGRPGTNVSLSCLPGDSANVTVSWQREERGPAAGAGGGRRQLAEGNTLLLPGLRYEDSGRYLCLGAGRPLRALRLLVEEPPETPRVSCYRRSHDKDVLCEWPLSARPSPGTRAMLWVKRRFAVENATEQRCRHFSRARKFVCRLKVPAGADDTKPLVVSTCASNAAGSAAGEDKIITLSGVLKPDPPLNVTVEPQERAPRRLRVAWSYPGSWDRSFYWLRFQLRYRPEPAPSFTHVDQVLTTSLDIHDAWQGTRHLVQVRAQEEFGHGSWSEWSPEVVGTPWTDPRDFTSEVAPWSSQFPTEDGIDVGTLPPELFEEDAAAGAVLEASARPLASPYAFLLAAGSLLLGIALFVGIVVRYRRLWRRRQRRRAKPEAEGQQMLAALAPPRGGTPLLAPPPGALPPGALHVTNLDYFFSGQ